VKLVERDRSARSVRAALLVISEECECPVGAVAQNEGPKPSTIAEKHYRRRPLDLLRKRPDQIDAWTLA